MRIRTLAAAALVAAGLSVTLTGAASAATTHEPPPPPGEPVIVTCVDGNEVVRPATEEDLKKIKEEMGSKFDGGPILKKREGEEPGRAIKVIKIDGFAPPGTGKGKVVVPPGAESGEKADIVCSAGEPAPAP